MEKKLTKLIFSVEDTENAKNMLMKYAGGIANDNTLFKKAIGVTYDKDYSYLSMKRSQLQNCKCIDAIFKSTALTGSNFLNTVFQNCYFPNVSMDFCLFYDCDLISKKEDCSIINANLGNTNIVMSRMKNLHIKTSTITNSLFDKSTFDACKIEYSSFENTIFHHCTFKRMELRNLNLEFTEFIEPSFCDVVLPFAQIPYAFGLLNSLKEHPQDVWISSEGNADKISVESYFEILPKIIPYYLETEEYFPLVNIYIALKEYANAFAAMKQGVQKASIEKNFRMLKYFCKLAVYDARWCNQVQRQMLCDFIYDINNFQPMTEYQCHNYYLHLGEFRKILLFEDNTKTTLYFQMHTNILPEEKQKLVTLLAGIDKIIDSTDEKLISSIELKHNSPYTILITILGVLAILELVAKGLSSVCTVVKDIQEIIVNNQQITMNKQQIKLNEQQLLLNQKQIDELMSTSENIKKEMIQQNIILKGDYYFTSQNISI